MQLPFPVYCSECCTFSCLYPVWFIEAKESFLSSGGSSYVFFLPLSEICEHKPERFFFGFAASLTRSSLQLSLWYCGSMLGQVMPSLLIVCWRQLAVGWHLGECRMKRETREIYRLWTRYRFGDKNDKLGETREIMFEKFTSAWKPENYLKFVDELLWKVNSKDCF